MKEFKKHTPEAKKKKALENEQKILDHHKALFSRMDKDVASSAGNTNQKGDHSNPSDKEPHH